VVDATPLAPGPQLVRNPVVQGAAELGLRQLSVVEHGQRLVEHRPQRVDRLHAGLLEREREGSQRGTQRRLAVG
jgi:hypothetical protein